MAENKDHINLRLISYNCNSVRKRIDIVRDLLTSCDVLVLQEIILLNEDLGFLYSIDCDFDVHAIPSKCSVSESFEGRPSGGLAILWRKSLNINLDVCAVHDNFMVVTISYGRWCVGLANIYMPYDDRSQDVVGRYSQVLGELQASLSEIDTDNIICIGDYNADPTRGRLWECVSDFCDTNEFSIADSVLEPDSFSYLSPSHNTTSWIDHILIAGDVILNDIKVNYNAAIFDHFPISAVVLINSDFFDNVVMAADV